MYKQTTNTVAIHVFHRFTFKHMGFIVFPIDVRQQNTGFALFSIDARNTSKGFSIGVTQKVLVLLCFPKIDFQKHVFYMVSMDVYQ